MATIGQFGSHQFMCSSNLVRSFNDLKIKADLETKDKSFSVRVRGNKKKTKYSYVTRKSGKAAEISLTVLLHAQLGCNVRSEAMQWISDAQYGVTSHFYIEGQKLVPYELMLTGADVDKIEISPTGKWISAEVKLTLKQAEKNVAFSS